MYWNFLHYLPSQRRRSKHQYADCTNVAVSVAMQCEHHCGYFSNVMCCECRDFVFVARKAMMVLYRLAPEF